MDSNKQQYWEELKEYINKILKSDSKYKLIVAGPGTGKTYFFKRAISYNKGGKNDYLVITFINNLVRDLDASLGSIARVYTFHGYCHYLLRNYSNLREHLDVNFEYYPPIIKLIKADWQNKFNDDSPSFVDLMRKLKIGKELKFFLERSNYYQAVGYDDSVFRVYLFFVENNEFPEKFKVVIVDEYQDFNYLETQVLRQVISNNPALIVGDDDQALYTRLRSSDPCYIRELEKGLDFENFSLPFCLRSPKAIVNVVEKMIQSAKMHELLKERIDKPFKFFPPKKALDSKKYPSVKHIECTIQNKKSNYGGKYIVDDIATIPKDEIIESRHENFPTALIIGPKHYINLVADYLDQEGYKFTKPESEDSVKIKREDGIKFIVSDRLSRLGWRIIIELEKTDNYFEIIDRMLDEKGSFYELIPEELKKRVLSDVDNFLPQEDKIDADLLSQNKESIDIRLTTFEGSKGLSAQHVYILGLQEGDLPQNSSKISDLEICKVLVAITRTRKQCTFITFKNFLGGWKKKSIFLDWISDETQYTLVNKEYFNK